MSIACAARTRYSWVVASLLAVVSMLAACQPREDSSPAPKSKSGAMVTLGERDAGRTVDVDRDQEILIRLPSNRTTGYSWALVSTDAGILRKPNDSVYAPDSTAAGMAGAGGMESWTFKAKQSGEEELRFEYRRPFEQDIPPAKTVSFTIRVR